MKKSLLLIIAVIMTFGVNAQIFTKDFEDQDLTSGGWTAVSVIGDQVWEVPADLYGHNESYCGKMTGYDGGSFENEDWFISPAFDADANPTLSFSFWNTSGYSGNALQAFYSNDYTGDVSTATWTEIAGITWHDIATQDYWEWTFSGEIDFSSVTGTSVYIAFKFTSTDVESSTWEIDDIVLSAGSSVNELNSMMNIFPNPATSVLNINSKSNINKIVVSNVIGQRIINISNIDSKNYSLEVERLTNGVYLINIVNIDGTSSITKFIKE